MAEKKTTRKTTSVKTVNIQEQLAEKRKELLEARKSLAAGELVNPQVINVYRKDIARILTTINNEKEGK